MSFIILTGMPGCGKTTLIKKIIEDLKKKNVGNVVGFYTEEVRGNEERIGFDIHLLDGSHGTLARIGSQSNHKVGKYSVHVDEFEQLTLPYLQEFKGPGYLIIDEVGKMELFSNKFRQFIENCFKLPNDSKLIMTVPLKSSDPFVTRLKKSKLFHITKGNRDNIYDEIIQAVI